MAAEIGIMGKSKEHPKYNVLSIRVTDEEKALMDEMKKSTRKSISMLLREALHLYSPQQKVNYSQGN
jgi:predicted transcriptional regulator